jgi:hypothetical protein
MSFPLSNCADTGVQLEAAFWWEIGNNAAEYGLNGMEIAT